MLKLIWIFLTLSLSSYASTDDLEKLLQDLGKKPKKVIPAPLPKLSLSNKDYVIPVDNNIFDSQRIAYTGSDLFKPYDARYNLNQIQMVGYLRFGNTNYAMLKTPYETIKVKVGDLVKNGRVVAITENLTEIDEVMIAEGKSYIKKRYYNLNQPSFIQTNDRNLRIQKKK